MTAVTCRDCLPPRFVSTEISSGDQILNDLSLSVRSLRHGPGSSEVITLLACHLLRGLISNLFGKCSLDINTRCAWTLKDGIVKP